MIVCLTADHLHCPQVEALRTVFRYTSACCQYVRRIPPPKSSSKCLPHLLRGFFVEHRGLSHDRLSDNNVPSMQESLHPVRWLFSQHTKLHDASP